MIIKQINLFRTKVPLTTPYRLSYGSIYFLDSLLANVVLENGNEGWGESTPLLGYNDNDIHSVYSEAKKLSPQLIGVDCEEFLCNPPISSDGFLITALWTALEAASGRIETAQGSVPLVGLVQENHDESPEDALKRIQLQGYRTFKIKVGNETVRESIQRITKFQDAARSGERIRIDANQSLSLDRAQEIVKICDPAKIELFEQPLPVYEWEKCAALSSSSPVPIMLDESITDFDSIKKAAHLGAAKLIKLKWMKQGGWFYLKKMVETADHFGMGVILGNGVAGPLNNFYEAMFWLKFLNLSSIAGEMNGFLKLRESSTDCPLKLENGMLKLLPFHNMKWVPNDDCIVECRTFL